MHLLSIWLYPSCNIRLGHWYKALRLVPPMTLTALMSVKALAQPPEAIDDNGQPSAELLAFLAEFGDVDEQTFELLLYHGLQDSQESAKSSEQSGERDDESR